MKPFHIIAALVVVSVAVFYSGCTDTAPGPVAGLGSVTVSGYVAIGDNTSAGFQSNGWFEAGQMYSFPNLLANQLKISGANVNFVQPLWSGYGTPIAGTAIASLYEIISLTGPVIRPAGRPAGAPMNLTYPAPYNNLSVPYATVFDFLNARDSNTCASALFSGRPNPLFTSTLRGIGTMFQQTALLKPNLVTFWLGNIDVLGYATSGGASPAAPTSPAQFQGLYSFSLDSLRTALGANAAILVATIPDIPTMPFFTTIPWNGLVLRQGQADTLNGATGGVFGFVAGANGFLAFTGAGSSTTPTPVKKLTANDYVLLTCSQDSLKLAGWGSRKPIPGLYVLDSAEVATARNAIASYNTAIATVAALPTHNALVVDVNALYGKLKSSGLLFAGQTVTSDYVKGGVFSLDGITPCAKGQGIIANEFIRVMNAKLGTSIPYVDIGSLPGIPAPL